MNRNFFIFTFLYFVLGNQYLLCQYDKVFGFSDYEQGKSNGIILGISGFRTTNYELGIAFNSIQNLDKKVPTRPFLGGSLSIEKNTVDKELLTCNLSLWLKAMVIYGLNFGLSDDKKTCTISIKPYFGFGFYNFNFIYGYSFFLGGNEIEQLYNNVFSIRYYFPIIKTKKSAL